MSEEFKIATVRSLYEGGLAAGYLFLTSYQLNGNIEEAGVIAGVAFLGYLIKRGGIEGLIDSLRRDRVPTPAVTARIDPPLTQDR